MSHDKDSKVEQIRFRLDNGSLDFIELVSSLSGLSSSEICRMFMYYGQMWAIECFSDFSEGGDIKLAVKHIKMLSEESETLKVKMSNIVKKNKLKGGRDG